MKVWITIGIVAATLFGIGIMQLIGGVDPMRNRGLGPGWECDVGKGAVCTKDVKTPK